MAQKPEIPLLSRRCISLYGDPMATAIGGDHRWQRIERVTETADCTVLPDDFEDGASEDRDLQDSAAEDPYQSALGDDQPFEDDHTDLWDVFLTDVDWAEPEPEPGDFWLDGL